MVKLQPATAALLCHCSWSLLAYAVRTAGTLPLDLINIWTVFDWYSCSWSTKYFGPFGGGVLCRGSPLMLLWKGIKLLITKANLADTGNPPGTVCYLQRCSQMMSWLFCKLQLKACFYFHGLLVFVCIRPPSSERAVPFGRCLAWKYRLLVFVFFSIWH